MKGRPVEGVWWGRRGNGPVDVLGSVGEGAARLISFEAEEDGGEHEDDDDEQAHRTDDAKYTAQLLFLFFFFLINSAFVFFHPARVGRGYFLLRSFLKNRCILLKLGNFHHFLLQFLICFNVVLVPLSLHTSRRPRFGLLARVFIRNLYHSSSSRVRWQLKHAWSMCSWKNNPDVLAWN